jgi:hypothetical protein
MTGESRIGGKVLSNQQARRPAVNKTMFGTFPIRYRQMIDASRFSMRSYGASPDSIVGIAICCRAALLTF